MICPKCHASLELPSNFCPHCGVSLQRRGGRVLIVTAGIVLAIVIGVYGYVNYRFFGENDIRTTAVAPDLEATPPYPPDGSNGTPVEGDPSAIEALLVNNTGTLLLRDITREMLGSYPVAIVSSGWFAFPTQLLIGAHTWQVELQDGRAAAVEGAILQDGDPAGLWEVTLNTPLGGPALVPWTSQRPLYWYPLDASGPGRRIALPSTETLGNFDRIALAEEDTAWGVFIQEGSIVGWSFGDWAPGGYLWTGRTGSALIPEFYTDDFYRLTFEGSREEALLLSLAEPALTDIQRLAALAEAYRLEARMPPDLVPQRITSAEVRETMLRLVEGLRNEGRSEELLALFDPQTLFAVNDPALFAELAATAREVGDYETALALVELQSQAAPEEVQQRPDVDAVQSVIYREWLNRLIAEGDEAAARAIYEEAADRFPQDPAIHLAGVELILQRGSWRLAERLLAARSYPPDLRDRVSRLERGINELKSQEGKLLIRFQPGSRKVPVLAVLDGSVAQPFLIDTGATVVTVPRETVRRLGIDLSGSLPRRLFYSATGAQNAIEVTLPSIEIDGWAVADVKALVVDLPGQPGFGLLGMNYLRNFRMDLDTDQGVLTLAPR